MADPKDILIDNLKVALSQLQRYMVFGLGASIFLLVLAITDPTRLSGIKLPSEFLPVPVPLSVAVALVLSAYWVAGWLATILVSRTNRIVESLRDSPELLNAALTYPSIPTTKELGPRIGLAILPALFVGIAAFITGHWPNWIFKVWVLFMLMLPYIVLAGRLRTAIGCGEVRHKKTRARE